jgi:phosphate-selective porin
MSVHKTIARAALILAALASTAAAAATGAAAPERAVAVTAATASAPIQSRDGRNRRVRIHNNTGWTMLRFYASNTSRTDWEEDILGDDVLANNASIVMNIDDGTGACLFDFKAEFTNGQSLIRNNVNVCEIADYYYTR